MTDILAHASREKRTRSRGALLYLASEFFAPEIAAWRGTLPLRNVFWVRGVLVSTGFAALYGSCLHLGEASVQQLLLIGMAAYSFWFIVSLWRTSRNHTYSVWGILARHLTVAWAINALLLLTFLQVDLLTVRLAQQAAAEQDRLMLDADHISLSLGDAPEPATLSYKFLYP